MFDHIEIMSSANRMPLKVKLYLNFLDFGFLAQFLLQGLAWAALGLLTQNHPQVVGICPGDGPQPIAQNIISINFGPKPLPPP